MDSSTLAFLSQQLLHLSLFVGPLVLFYFAACAGIVWLSERSRWKGSKWLRCLSGWLQAPGKEPRFKVGLTIYLLSVSAALITGFIGGEVLRYKTSRSYRLEILQNYDPLNALVRKINKQGEVLGEPWQFRTCPHETAPDFDTGMVVDVTFEITSDAKGECNTFTGPRGSYIAERDPLNPKKFADFRAPEWRP